MTSSSTGFLFYFLSLFISNLNDILFKFLGERLPCMQVTCLRFTFAALSLLIFGVIAKKSFKTSLLKVHFFRGLILFTGMALWCLGLSKVPLTDAIALNFTIPMFTLVLARILLHETIDRPRLISTFIGFIGMLFITRPTSAHFNPACLFVIASAVLFALSDILNKYYVQKESTLSMLLYTALFTACIGVGPTALYWVSPTALEYLMLVVLGVGANVLLFFLLKALERIEASATAPIRYLELLLSAVSGYLFFQEVPHPLTWVGALLIIPSTIALLYYESTDSKN